MLAKEGSKKVAKKKVAKKKVAKKNKKRGIMGFSRTREFRFFIPHESKAELSKTEHQQFTEETIPLAQACRCDLAALTKENYETAQRVIQRIAFSSDINSLSVIDQLSFLFACKISVRAVPGYATLSGDLIEEINSFIRQIGDYIRDSAQKRPLNFLMLTSPGAGKSHLIKCITRANGLKSRKVESVTYNMANLQTCDDLLPALDTVRNLKVEDKVPLLFLDEFDSEPRNVALLLPLLWDGTVALGQRQLGLGKVVIVMAGSAPNLPGIMEHARSMRKELPKEPGHSPKLVDLFSRVNGGVLDIPPFQDAGRKIDRRADKVCVAIKLIHRRYGESLKTVPRSLLTFIAKTQFRYGVRSIAHLVDQMPYIADISDLQPENVAQLFDDTSRMKKSSMAYHLVHEDNAHGIQQAWNNARKNDQQVHVNTYHTSRVLPYVDVVDSKDPETVEWAFHMFKKILTL